MRRLKSIMFALLLLAGTRGTLAANIELHESNIISLSVRVNECNPTTCGGGGS